MPEEPFEVIEAAGVPVVKAPQEIDIKNAGDLRSALLIAAARHPSIVVDLSATEFCDSSGLNVLVRALQEAQVSGGEIRLVVATPAVRRILTVSGMLSLFGVYSSLPAALGPLASPGNPARSG